MIIQPLTIAAAASLTAGASTISGASLVLVQNTSAAVKYVNIEEKATGTRKSSVMIPAASNLIIKKDTSDEIFASAAAAGTGAAIGVLFTKVGYGN